MTGSTAKAVTLLLTLLLSAPTLSQLSSGELALEPALLRCGLALLLCGVGVSVLAQLLRAYAPDATPAAATAGDPPVDGPAPGTPRTGTDKADERRR